MTRARWPAIARRAAGSGLVDAAAAIGTDVVALGDVKVTADRVARRRPAFQTANLSFGFAELGKDFSADQGDHDPQ